MGHTSKVWIGDTDEKVDLKLGQDRKTRRANTQDALLVNQQQMKTMGRKKVKEESEMKTKLSHNSVH